MKGCYQVACEGKDLTTWDQVEVILYFFGPIAILLIIMIGLLVWLLKK